jgi:hypothetical protein
MRPRRRGFSALNRTRFQGWLLRVCSNPSAIPPATARSSLPRKHWNNSAAMRNGLPVPAMPFPVIGGSAMPAKQLLRKGSRPLSKVAQEWLHSCRDQRSLRSATGPSLTSLWSCRLSPRALVTACKAHKSAGLPSGCWLASFHCGSAPRRLRSTPAPQQPDRSTDYPHFSPSGANGRVLLFTRLSNLCSSHGLCGGSAVASSAR